MPPLTGRPHRRPAAQELFRRFEYLTSPFGTSTSGFRAEVESEQALARGEQLPELTIDHIHPFTGPTADEVAIRLQAFTDHAQVLGFAGTVIADPARLRRALGRHNLHVQPGPSITGVFDPDRVLCERRPDAAGRAGGRAGQSLLARVRGGGIGCLLGSQVVAVKRAGMFGVQWKPRGHEHAASQQPAGGHRASWRVG